MPFIAAQFFPRFYTLLPAGLFVGFGGGPLWCAKCTYLTIIAEAYVAVTGNKQKVENVVVRFFGLFFVFYQMAQVWGNLISSTGELLKNRRQ
jgi:thiol-disulfide isomerase/thioredoxin